MLLGKKSCNRPSCTNWWVLGEGRTRINERYPMGTQNESESGLCWSDCSEKEKVWSESGEYKPTKVQHYRMKRITEKILEKRIYFQQYKRKLNQGMYLKLKYQFHAYDQRCFQALCLYSSFTAIWERWLAALVRHENEIAVLDRHGWQICCSSPPRTRIMRLEVATRLGKGRVGAYWKKDNKK